MPELLAYGANRKTLREAADVPVRVAAGWSEAQKGAYVIADNKLALNAGWDEELLALELGDLGVFELSLTASPATSLRP